MAFGVVMLFDVVATLRGAVVGPLGLGATTLVASESTVGRVTCCLAMIVVSSWMAWMCLIFAAVDVGTLPPITLRRSAATAMERSCCKAAGIWQWAEYRRHVSKKRNHCVAGM
jgi:hypothetical protein